MVTLPARRARATIDHSVTFVIVAVLFVIAFPKFMSRAGHESFGAWPLWGKVVMIGVPAVLGLLLASYVLGGGGQGLASRAGLDATLARKPPEPERPPPETPPRDSDAGTG